MTEKRIRIGSRESVLAVKQTEIIIEALQAASPGLETELLTMKTTGDRILDRPLELVGGKGLFVRELDQALLSGACDLTVSSLKDMPMEVNEEIPILAYSRREDRRDVLVLRKGLAALPACPVLGTSSKRRRIQAKRLYPGAEFKGCRGNLLTRLKKLDSGEYDGLILAAAGLIRLGLGDRISRYFEIEEMLPPAGQGILAVQGRRDFPEELADAVNCRESEEMARAERAFVRALDGGCSVPAAATAFYRDGRLVIYGFYYEEETGSGRTGMIEGKPGEEERLGEELALRLKEGRE